MFILKCIYNSYSFFFSFRVFFYFYFLSKKHESSRDTWKIIFVTECSILLIFVDFGAFVFSFLHRVYPLPANFRRSTTLVVVLAAKVECLILNKGWNFVLKNYFVNECNVNGCWMLFFPFHCVQWFSSDWLRDFSLLNYDGGGMLARIDIIWVSRLHL